MKVRFKNNTQLKQPSLILTVLMLKTAHAKVFEKSIYIHLVLMKGIGLLVLEMRDEIF